MEKTEEELLAELRRDREAMLLEEKNNEEESEESEGNEKKEIKEIKENKDSDDMMIKEKEKKVEKEQNIESKCNKTNGDSKVFIFQQNENNGFGLESGSETEQESETAKQQTGKDSSEQLERHNINESGNAICERIIFNDNKKSDEHVQNFGAETDNRIERTPGMKWKCDAEEQAFQKSAKILPSASLETEPPRKGVDEINEKQFADILHGFTVCVTGAKTVENEQLLLLAEHIGASVVVEKWDPQNTHSSCLVCCEPTELWKTVVDSGGLVVKPGWIKACAQARQHVNELLYLIDPSDEEQCKHAFSVHQMYTQIFSGIINYLPLYFIKNSKGGKREMF